MAGPIIGTPLPYKNRTIYPAYQDDGSIIITYLSSKTEAERIASSYGQQFVSTDGDPPTKYFVSIGTYPKNSSNFGVFQPGEDKSILSGISNNDLSLAIKQDRNFYTTVSQVTTPATGPGGTTPATPGGPIQLPVVPPTTGPGGTTPPPVQNPDEQGGSTPITQPTTGTEPTDVMLVYPEDLRSNKQDRIMFQVYEYRSGGRLLSGPKEGEFGELNPVQYIKPKDVGPVFLPIQSSITDQNNVGWESDTLNPIEVQVAELSEKLMLAPTPKQMGTELSSFYNQALTAAKFSGDQIRTYLVGQGIGVNNLLSRLQGQVLNPNLELLFTGPQLRPFNYTFKMSARSRKEATTIKKIIKYFKKNMAVKKDNVIFLKAPNVFKIQYQYGDSGKAHPGLNLIKMCALTNCAVDYTPLGTYMTYNDGTMVAYTMTLSFQELTPIYNTDYDNDFIYGGEAGDVKKDYYYDQNNGIGA